MQIAESDQLEEGVRCLAAEFLVTLCEAREKAPGMMRKLPQVCLLLGEFVPRSSAFGWASLPSCYTVVGICCSHATRGGAPLASVPATPLLQLATACSALATWLAHILPAV